MNNAAKWEKHNDQYLAAALAWLRLRLARLNKSAVLTDAEVSEAVAAVSHARTLDPPPALIILSQLLGLSPFEEDVLLLCVAMELDTRIRLLCARAQDDPQKPCPTFALAFALFDAPTWDILSPERPLRYWRLIEINQSGAQPLTSSPLRADERIVNYLKGMNCLDDRLTPFLVPLQLDPGLMNLAPSQEKVVERIVRLWKQVDDAALIPVVQLTGIDPTSKQLVAHHASAQVGRRLYRIPVELLPAQPAEQETLARLWQRESILLPIALYLDAQELDSANAERITSLSRLLMRSSGILFVGVRETVPSLGWNQISLDVAKPLHEEQQAAWARVLDSHEEDTTALLAGQFNLNLSAIQHLSEVAKGEVNGSSQRLREKVWEVCCTYECPRLDSLAQRLEPKATWDDLVLPATEVNILRQIASQVGQRFKVHSEWGFARKMSRGFGISALFAGDSGTGKTMAAEVIASELRLNLYRIDLSAVVNKYIGETEKNLRRLFDAAEDGGAILFFDEADALFGKRSEVKDSHDRYANIEINYLLQRMEVYRGLAILATNMKAALDSAFMRRLRFLVNFPFPGLVERRAIWQKVFPQETPRAGLDFDRLARLNLTGGSIHSIALNAAFLAAHARTAVTMPLIFSAARDEFRKLERPINEADFRWLEPAEVLA
ncbi:MAG: ATP-binding protein [Bacteroidota bacterium]